MISQLTGILVFKDFPYIVVDVSGVGFEMSVSMNSYEKLPTSSQPTKLFTHLIVREDGFFLYGFVDLAEKNMFKQLTKVTGIGARTALSLLSCMQVSEIVQGIHDQEVNRFIKTPGIGKKTAERLVLELKDSISAKEYTRGGGDYQKHNDIYQALATLGYSDREIQKGIKSMPEDLELAESIKFIMARLAQM